MKFPVLLMRDRLGQTSAQVVGWPRETSVFGGTERETLDRLKHYLRWLERRPEGLSEAWSADMQLIVQKVAVRCQYENNERAFPCAEEFPLRTVCLHAKFESGAHVGILPLLDARFYFYDLAQLPDLVERSVQDAVKDLTPWQLSALFTPASYRLETVHIPLRKPRRTESPEPELTKLRSVADPLTEEGARKDFGQAWERDAEVAQVAGLLKRPRVNLLLVGEPGAGKTTVLSAAVRTLVRKTPGKKTDVDENPAQRHRHLRFWMTNGARLIAGMKYLGQWEERCEQVIAELGEVGGVLCVENLLDLVRVGSGEPAASVANFLSPYLQRSELRMVAECSPRELDACRRLLPGLTDLFEIVTIPPFDATKAAQVLTRQGTLLEQQRNVEYLPGVMELIERLFRRFQPYRAQPGSSVAFLKDLSRTKAGRRAQPNRVGPLDVLSSFVTKTGLPEALLRDDLPLDAADVLAEFRRKIIGQSAATEAAADLVLTFKAGLNDPQRPIGVFLLCGPTGVGKTETAKALADYVFGHGAQRQRLIRLDMSEFSGYDAARRFTERPDGEPSALIQAIRQQPLAVVLLDEIEKAAPDVFDVLLTVLDEGRLADRFGRVTDFRTAILVMTSNLGAELQRSIGFHEAPEPGYERAVRGHFRPEFVNRIDRVLTFGPLGEESVRDIARRELASLNQRDGLVRRRLRFTWSDALLEAVTRQGFDPRYGARPLQRTVERLVAAPLAAWLNAHAELTDREIVAEWASADQQTRFAAK